MTKGRKYYLVRIIVEIIILIIVIRDIYLFKLYPLPSYDWRTPSAMIFLIFIIPILLIRDIRRLFQKINSKNTSVGEE